MGKREEVIVSNNARQDAVSYVTAGKRHTLVVEEWLDAGNPSGTVVEHCWNQGCDWSANAKKGIRGYVAETGQSFTIRDDYDYANPGPGGKGYHVNVQLGKDPPRAYCTPLPDTGPLAYEQRAQMSGERYLYDGPAEAAMWYVNGGRAQSEVSVRYQEKK